MSKKNPPKLVRDHPPKDFTGSQAQFEKFLTAAREAGGVTSETAFNKVLKRVGKAAVPAKKKPKRS